MELNYKALVAGWDDLQAIIDEIKVLPTLEKNDKIFIERDEVGKILAKHSDVQIVQHSNWKYDETNKVMYCERCGAYIGVESVEQYEKTRKDLNFCFKCGANMKISEENEDK